MSRDMPPSGRPCDQAKPELVVASALKPRLCRNRALPTSQGFGMTKHPASCNCRKARRLSSMLSRASVMENSRWVVKVRFCVNTDLAKIADADGQQAGRREPAHYRPVTQHFQLST